MTAGLLNLIVLMTEHAAGAVDTTSAAGMAGAEAAGEGPVTELPSLLTFLSHTFAEHYAVLFYGLLMAVLLVIVAVLAVRKRAMIPGGLQNVAEMIVEALYDLIYPMLGKETDRYLPFLGTLFVYIWFMNLAGLVPFFHSSTAALNMTGALAVSVFLYVQYTALTRLGPLKYLYHLAGQPDSAVTWAMVVINLPLHIISEFVRPVSLALRLFGNIFGEDILIATMAWMGVQLMGLIKVPVGVPFQVPFYFLAMLTSTIQALVFMMLSTAYIILALPHEHETEPAGNSEIAKIEVSA
jgi:F-type H+-transporting ATPase subunit a